MGDVGDVFLKPRAAEQEGMVNIKARNDALLIMGMALGVIALLIVGAIVMYQTIYADRVYLGISSVGVDLGGDTAKEAQTSLAGRFDQYARTPLTLRYGGKEWKATPEEMGLRLDAEKTAKAAFQIARAQSLPQRLATQVMDWRNGAGVSLAYTIDQAQQDAFLSRLAREIDQSTMDAKIVVQPDLQVRISSSQAGRKLDTSKMAQALQKEFSTLASAAIDLPVEESQPQVLESGTSDAKAAAEKILAAPLVLRYGDRSWQIDPKDLQGMLTFAQQGSGAGQAKLVAALDDQKLTDVITKVAAEIDQSPMNSRFDFTDGKLTPISQSKDGLKLDVAAAVAAVKSQAPTDQKTVMLPVNVIKPAFSAGDVGTLSAEIKEKIEEASTHYGDTVPERRHNVELAAQRLNGIVVAPGEIFSFNKDLGPTSLQSGFETAWGIEVKDGNIETVPAEAGGICQVATTLFHTVFWAGYEIEERVAHLYWIPRYGQPPDGLTGLDATVDDPAPDFQWQNNTSTPVLIQTKTDGQDITFTLYGQKPTWQVKVDPPVIEDVVKTTQAVERQPDPTHPVGWSLWTEEAEDGFKSTIVRTVTDGNGPLRVLRIVSRYMPSRNVLAVGTKPVAGQPTPTPTVHPGQPTPQPGANPAATPTPTPKPGR